MEDNRRAVEEELDHRHQVTLNISEQFDLRGRIIDSLHDDIDRLVKKNRRVRGALTSAVAALEELLGRQTMPDKAAYIILGEMSAALLVTDPDPEPLLTTPAQTFPHCPECKAIIEHLEMANVSGPFVLGWCPACGCLAGIFNEAAAPKVAGE